MEEKKSKVREKRIFGNYLHFWDTVVRYGYLSSGTNNHALELRNFVFNTNDTLYGFTTEKVLEFAELIYDYTDFPSYYHVDCRVDCAELMEIITQHLTSSFYYD